MIRKSRLPSPLRSMRAQRLTIAAAEEAVFLTACDCSRSRQAAFYSWLGRHDAAHELRQRLDEFYTGPRHALVIDIRGGTSDFSLFELHLNEPSAIPDIRRVAVSEHILLGGDNVDLAIAHFMEPRLAETEAPSSPPCNGLISLPPAVI